MKKSVFKDYSGYSLIEMIIVIAIIAVTATMSLVSLTIINSARAKDAAIKFDSEVAELIQKNKNMTPGSSGDGKYGLMLYFDPTDDKLKMSHLSCELDSGDYVFRDDGSGYPIFDETSEISKRVDVEFDGTYTSFLPGSAVEFDRTSFRPSNPNGTGAICIMFDKQGHCISGYGKYSFKKVNGNTVSTVTIKQNGSHEVR